MCHLCRICGKLRYEAGNGGHSQGGVLHTTAPVLDPTGQSIERFLRHQNLWTDPLGLAEARPPPHFRSITRLKPSPQVELFE